MAANVKVDWLSWRAFASGRRQGLERRKLLLTWLLLDQRHQGLSAREVGARCPVYENYGGGEEARARNDLNVMQDYDCTVQASRNRPAQWNVTAYGAGID